MATSPPTDGASLIQLDDEIEGEELGSRNYRFSKIGEPVPIRSTTFKFDPESLPTQPLVVSEKFRLLFVAHPCGKFSPCHSHAHMKRRLKIMTHKGVNFLILYPLYFFFVAFWGLGFYVTRTRDVVASAEQIKDNQTAKSVQELCLVDVPVQNMTMLALSPDDSMLAATEGSSAHFFAVSALLHKARFFSWYKSVVILIRSIETSLLFSKQVKKADNSARVSILLAFF